MLSFVNGFLCYAKTFKFNEVPIVYFCSCFLCVMKQIKKKIEFHVREYMTRVYFHLGALWFLVLYLDL